MRPSVDAASDLPGDPPSVFAFGSIRNTQLQTTPALDRARSSNERLREEIYADLQPLVKRLVRRYGDDREGRADLKGEIYCRFCDILDAYDPGRGIPLRPYLIRQLSASVHTYARRCWRENRRKVAIINDLAGGESLPTMDPTTEWDDRIYKQRLCAELPDHMAGIPRRQKMVVVWRYYEGAGFQEIADRLGVQVATARSLLRHGINNLRKRMCSLDGVSAV